jgi:hypothetical protein
VRDRAKHAAYQKLWRAKNAAKHAAYVKAWGARNPVKVAAASKMWRAKNPGIVRQQKVRSILRRAEKLTAIAGRPRPTECELCGERPRRIVFDHCHATGAFRGWLCDRCNLTLGQAKDDAKLLTKMNCDAMVLAKMISYLSRGGANVRSHSGAA